MKNAANKGAITLETARLLLRPYTANDFKIAESWRNNPANSRYLNFEPGNEEQTREWRKRVTERALAEPRLSYDFAVELKNSGNVIGTCGVYCDSNFDTAGVAWLLHIDNWNKGYGTELGGVLLRFGFESLRLRRIIANCVAENHASYRIMERNGMRREATKIKSFWAQVDKQWIDEAEYAILAEEWSASKGEKMEIKQIASENEIQATAQLADIIWREYFTPLLPPGQVDYMLEKFQSEAEMSRQISEDGYKYYLIYIDKIPAGYCAVKPEDGGSLFLSKLYVRLENRGQGLSRKMLKFAINNEANITRVHLTVNRYNSNSIAVYKHMGFTIYGEKAADIGGGYVMDDYLMELNLTK